MNVDTDTQYAFTRPIAGHMFTNYDGVLKVDGEVGNKKVYDPRSYLKKAEAGDDRARHRGVQRPAQRRPVRHRQLIGASGVECGVDARLTAESVHQLHGGP